MTIGDWVPDGTETARPNAARVYDYYLGGSHNFEADREMARRAIALWPDVPKIIRANRAFLHRAVRFIAAQGVRQFIDLGSGMPTVGSVHEVARSVRPDARVVYVDIDPVVVAHARMILDGDPNAAIVHADLSDADAVLDHPDLRRLLDRNEPIAVLMIAVLHFVLDENHPAQIVAGYRDALVPGSYIAVTHATQDGQRPEQASEHRELYARTATPMTMRSHDEIGQLLAGWTLVDPGLVRMPLWRPDSVEDLPDHPEEFAGYGAVGRLPTPADDHHESNAPTDR
ncbi:MAG TPA: SAM-dependent methyltransferase [Micromonosporaceae bacterium]